MRNTLTTLFTVALLLTGCQIFNPYSEESHCKNTDFGQCMSLEEAYERSKDVQVGNDSGSSNSRGEENTVYTGLTKKEYRYSKSRSRILSHRFTKTLHYKHVPFVIRKDKNKEEEPKQLYEKGKYKTLSGLIRQSEKPLLVPPKILKVLIYPYSSGERSEVFNMHRVVFLKVEDSKWIFDPNASEVE